MCPKKSDRNQETTRQGGQPKQGNDPLDGKPKQQKSDQPQGGESGQTKQNDAGSPSDKNQGAGDSSSEKGDADPSQEKPGDGSRKQQDGADSSSGADKSGGKSSQQQTAKDSRDQGDLPEDSPSGDAKGAPGEKPVGRGQQKSQSGTGGLGAEDAGGQTKQGDPASATGEGTGDGGAIPQGDKANLEYAKQAANLVLKRLQKELERGEVDPDLLEELGWSDGDMKKFVNRLQERLQDSGADQSPAAVAERRQFEEMLKSLELQSKGARRSDSGKGKHSTDGIGSRRLPVPAEYREAFEAYTKSLSQRDRSRKRSVPAPR